MCVHREISYLRTYKNSINQDDMAALRKSVEPIGTREIIAPFLAKVRDRIYMSNHMSDYLFHKTNFFNLYLPIAIYFPRFKPALILITVLVNNNIITKISIVDILSAKYGN